MSWRVRRSLAFLAAVLLFHACSSNRTDSVSQNADRWIKGVLRNLVGPADEHLKANSSESLLASLAVLPNVLRREELVERVRTGKSGHGTAGMSRPGIERDRSASWEHAGLDRSAESPVGNHRVAWSGEELETDSVNTSFDDLTTWPSQTRISTVATSTLQSLTASQTQSEPVNTTVRGSTGQPQLKTTSSAARSSTTTSSEQTSAQETTTTTPAEPKTPGLDVRIPVQSDAQLSQPGSSQQNEPSLIPALPFLPVDDSVAKPLWSLLFQGVNRLFNDGLQQIGLPLPPFDAPPFERDSPKNRPITGLSIPLAPNLKSTLPSSTKVGFGSAVEQDIYGSTLIDSAPVVSYGTAIKHDLRPEDRQRSAEVFGFGLESLLQKGLIKYLVGPLVSSKFRAPNRATTAPPNPFLRNIDSENGQTRTDTSDYYADERSPEYADFGPPPAPFGGSVEYSGDFGQPPIEPQFGSFGSASPFIPGTAVLGPEPPDDNGPLETASGLSIRGPPLPDEVVIAQSAVQKGGSSDNIDVFETAALPQDDFVVETRRNEVGNPAPPHGSDFVCECQDLPDLKPLDGRWIQMFAELGHLRKLLHTLMADVEGAFPPSCITQTFTKSDTASFVPYSTFSASFTDKENVLHTINTTVALYSNMLFYQPLMDSGDSVEVCVVDAGMGAGFDGLPSYSYLILSEPANLCKSLSVLVRSPGEFIGRERNTQLADFIRQAADSGVMAPLTVIPYGEQCSR